MLDLHNAEIFRAALDSLPTGVCLVDLDRTIHFWNEGAEKITGYLRQDVLGRTCGDVLLLKFQEKSASCEVHCPIVAAMREGQVRESRTYLHHRTGYAFPISLRSVPIRNAQGRVVGAVISIVERPWSSKRWRPESSLAVGHGLDALTDLPDPTFTESYLRERLKFAAEHSVSFGVLCIRLDRLDAWKATHGLNAAEAIVNVVAHTLRNGLDPLDFVGRWSEDEFLAMISNCNDSDVLTTAERLKQLAQSSEIVWWGDKLSITALVAGGVTTAGESLDALLARIGAAPARPEAKTCTPRVSSAGKVRDKEK